MAKYYKFNYSAGYAGTDVTEVHKFADDVSEEEVQEAFEDWYDSQRCDEGYFDEISEEEAEEVVIDEDLEAYSLE